MSVFKRGKYWYARIYWRDDSRKRHSKSKGHFKTKKEASMWEAQAKTDLNHGFNIKDNPPFVDYYWNYYKLYKKRKVRYETRRSYHTAYLVLKENLGPMRIKSIRREDWQKFLNRLADKYARSSVVNFFKKYHPAVKAAIQDGLIKADFTNETYITGSTERTRLDKVKMLSVEQIKALIKLALDRRRPFEMASTDSLKGNMSDYMIITLILTGMRLGEASALTWDDIDFENKTISISKAMNRDTRKVGKPKTFSSNRKIAVNAALLDVLKELRDNHTKNVFGLSKMNGLPPSGPAVNRELRRMMKKLGYPTEGFSAHMLRHCHVALLLYWGADIYEVRDRLGHYNISTTLDTYGYLIKEKKKHNTKMITSKLDKLV